MTAIVELAVSQHTETSTAGWAKLVFLVWTLFTFYCIFNARVRNFVFGECHKLRGMKKTGSPASVRTAVIAFLLSSGVLVSMNFPRFWDWDYSGVLFLSLYGIVMVSSYLDARSYRKRNW